MKKEFNWKSGLFLIIYTSLFFILLPTYLVSSKPSFGLILISVLLVLACAFGITAGYHRMYSHRAYKINKFIEIPLLLFGTLAAENSALRWSADHRMHHRFVDTDKDPYSIKKGFWYAHVLWIFETNKVDYKKVVPDLLKDKLVMFQDSYYTFLLTAINAFVFFAVGFAFNDFFGAFVFVILARIFFVHHLTWFINSLAHMWGSQNYSKEFSAVDNWLISLVTMGEGYHNYHHTYASDYRNGVKWYNYDPTKWVVWSLSIVKLSSGLKKIRSDIIKSGMVNKDRKLLLKKIDESMAANKKVLEEKVNDLSQKINESLRSIRNFKEELKLGKYNKIGKENLLRLKLKITELKKSLKAYWRDWFRLLKEVNTLPSPSLL